MTPEQFVYWLQGFVEVTGETRACGVEGCGQDACLKTNITDQQWQIVKDHLKEVFQKKTPNYIFGESKPVPMPGVGSALTPNKLQYQPYQPTYTQTAVPTNTPGTLIC